MATILRTGFTDLFEERLPFLREIFYEENSEPMSMMEQVFNMMTSDRFREQTTGISGLPLAALTPEAGPVTYEALLQAFDKTYTHSKYTLGWQISEEALDDDQDGPLRNASRALGRSMRTTRNTIAWNVFNFGFTSELTPDGVSLFNASHPLLEGGTFSNTVSADLDLTSLENAINTFADMRDHRGLLIEMEPSNLVFPSELRWVVREILGSPEKPTTANRSINSVFDILNPIMVKYLTNATDWFITTNPGEHALMFFTRQEATFQTDIDFDNGVAKAKSVQRHSQGASDWRGLFGGNGA